MSEKIDKIVELGIDIDDMDQEMFEDLGVDVISLVENPAIEVDFLAFQKLQQFVEPNAGETEEEFIGRCMSSLDSEFPDAEQRLAVCYQYWEGNEEFCEDCFDLEDACQPGYIAIGLKPKGGRMVPNCVPVETAQEFSYTDYPEAVKENAARGIRLNEAVDNRCATQVGKVRAQQLANGEPISLETVTRMKSYLSRQAGNYNPDDTEACGTISYLLWGGEEALAWATRTLERENEEFYKKKKKKKSQYATEEEQEAILAFAREAGEPIMAEDTILDLSTDQFNTVGNVLDAIKGLDILDRLSIKKGEAAETRYVYSGPPAQRKFCRAMQRLNRMFTRTEIAEMMNINRDFGHDGAAYSKWSFKGGPRCKHFWSEVAVFKDTNGQKVIINKGPATGRAGVAPNDMPKNGYFSQQFSLDEDKRIAVGPVMIPNKMILRRDEDGNAYYVYFTKKTIAKMAEKFLARNKHNNTDVEHDGEVKTDNTLLESWITADMVMDKAATYGFAVPPGTWMASYKINNDEDWQRIKNGEVKGFSLAGNFLERFKPQAELDQDEERLNEIKKILRDVQ